MKTEQKKTTGRSYFSSDRFPSSRGVGQGSKDIVVEAINQSHHSICSLLFSEEITTRKKSKVYSRIFQELLGF